MRLAIAASASSLLQQCAKATVAAWQQSQRGSLWRQAQKSTYGLKAIRALRKFSDEWFKSRRSRNFQCGHISLDCTNKDNDLVLLANRLLHREL